MLIALGFIGFIFFLRILSERGKYYPAARVFVGLLFLIGLALIATWSIILPTGLIMIATAVVAAGILLGPGQTLFVGWSALFSFILILFLQQRGIIRPDFSWMSQKLLIEDAIWFGCNILLVAVVAWLGNRELEAMLNRAQHSEAALIRERDKLEETVIERTRDLREAQLANVLEISRFAEWGRLATGILHDLLNPLTVVSVNLQKIGAQEDSEQVKRALEGTQAMQTYLEAARRQLRNEQEITTFKVGQELTGISQLLQYKAQQAGVRLTIQADNSVTLHGSIALFSQIITNVVANAIDACSEQKKGDRSVNIRAKEDEGVVMLQIIDTGVGMTPEAQAHATEPFFSTKKGKGTGLGLAIVHELVTRDFNGELRLSSEPMMGTTVTLILRNKKTA